MAPDAVTPTGGAPSPEPPDRGGQAPARLGRQGRTELGHWIRTFGIALVVMVVIRAFLVQSFVVPTGSMENTLVPGDRILVSRLDRGPSISRGDVVVFDGTDTWGAPSTASRQTGIAGILASMASFVSLGSGADYVKRVVGVPGDRVTCCDTSGRLTVNGVPVDEPYLYPGNVPSTMTFDVIVPAGRIWVMGDHRSNSADSRSHLGQPGGGMIPLDDVVGRAWVRYWPLDRLGSIDTAPGLASIPAATP